LITEIGTVVAVEPDAVWVETIRQSTCEACSARNGCGQKMLASIAGRMARIRVMTATAPTMDCRTGDRVLVGIPENVVVLGSLQVYLIPLLAMVGATVFADRYWSGDLQVGLAGIAGLLIGGLLVRWLSWRQRHNPNLQPVLLNFVEQTPVKGVANID